MKEKMKFRQTLFWDVNPKNIDVKKNAQYIIERVADFGNDEEVRWVLSFYDKRLIKKVILKSRCIRLETRKQWSLMLGIKEQKLKRPMTRFERDMLKIKKCFG